MPSPNKKTKGRSEEATDYRRWYGLAIWRKVLRPNQLTKEPLCQFCWLREMVTAADTVDHRTPHKGDWSLFTDPENLQSLCGPCHTKAKADQERYGFHMMTDLKGFPIDPNHPANR